MREAHPQCPRCKKSMYKSPLLGTIVKTTDTWGWCRNNACALYNTDQSASSRFKPATPEEFAAARVKVDAYNAKLAAKKTGAPVAKVEKRAEQPTNAPKVKPKPTPPPTPSRAGNVSGGKRTAPSLAPVKKASPGTEHEAVRLARARIRAALNAGTPLTGQAIGLALTIVAQEMGDQAVANKLIDEHNLTELYGIQQVK